VNSRKTYHLSIFAAAPSKLAVVFDNLIARRLDEGQGTGTIDFIDGIRLH
jgi:hypothetical protein